MTDQSTQSTFDEIRQLFRETDAKFKETGLKFKETDAKLVQEIEATNASLRRLEGLFTSQWGKMLEALIDLNDFLRFFPRYRGLTIYGAVAGLTMDENADRFAYRRGLFVLGVSEDGLATIHNDRDFRPRDFGKLPL